MSDQTQHISIELTAKEDDARFLVKHEREIVRIMRGLIKHREMTSAFFNEGRDLLLTSVLDVDQDHRRVILDYSSNPALIERIRAATKIIFVTTLEKVKIQWVSPQVTHTTFEGADAFSIALPSEILQLQRREYFRLTTPVINPLLCVVPLENGDTTTLTLADIGSGGIGMLLGHPPGTPLDVGTVLPGCRITLPGEGTIEATLRVQNTFEITLKNGTKTVRSGCQFINLRPAMQAMVQRYLVKLERERIANNAAH